jgi:hypothetical protein
MALRLALLVLLARAAAAQGEPLWSLRPVTRPAPPAVAGDAWCRNPIDRFVLARLEAVGLAPAPEASPRDLARRLHLTLGGLPPDPDEPPVAHEVLVERLLASPRYGERWARHWLDLARFAETNGFETNTPRPNAWPYRDWVIRAFNEDMPYDAFLFAQVAGDTVGEDAATGFLVAGAMDEVKSPDVVLTRNQRQDELTDMVNAVSTGFLGLTVACARCHDHEFDPLSQRDFFAVQALFSGVQHGERPLRTELDAARVEDVTARLDRLRATLDALAAAARPAPPTPGLVVIDDEDERRAAPLLPIAGHGVNPAGTARGERDDAGDVARTPNLSRGRYTWWDGARDEDVFEVRPGVTGRYRIRVSWGAGWDTHARDASWWLERDGVRRPLAVVDQQAFADGSDSVRQRPLWSGLHDVGVHELTAGARLVLRAGSDGRPVTADVVLLEPAPGSADAPRLRAAVDARGNEERFSPAAATAVRFVVRSTVGGAEPCLDELEVYAGGVNVARDAAEIVTSGDYAGDPQHRPEHVNDGVYGNARSWISSARGGGWIELRLPAPALVERVFWARDREGRYADRLARDYSIEVREADGPWRVVASGDDRLPPDLDAPLLRFAGCPDLAEVSARLAEQRALEAELAALRARPVVYAGRFEQPPPTHLLHRGDPLQPLEEVAPGLPEVLGSLALAPDAPEAERRAAFGRWLGDPHNPLTPRVLVNRLWAQHFGVGLVATPSDLGHMGAAPSHPLLLDWLAAELVDSGWSVKHVQRLIVTSSTWRQSSARDPRAAQIDADARRLWRFPPRRMEAEVVRDAMLAVSGALDLTAGGPGFSAFEPNTNYVRNYVPRADFAPDGMRRMIYMTNVRMEREATFGLFDTPDAGQVCAVRGRSVTPLQALSLLNSPFVLDQAERFAARLEAEAADVDARIARAFQLALGRAPTERDRAEARALVLQHGLRALCRALFNSSEFLFLP